METVNVHATKTNLSKLLAKVEKGEEIIISRAGKPVAKLVRISEHERLVTPRKPRQGGQWTGKVHYESGFDEADKEIEKMFNESKIFPKD